jgi:FkbM family methyltransferase
MSENLLMKIASLKYLRAIVIYFLKITSRDLSMKNPYSNKKIILNSYLHKGYWYFQRYREEKTINSIKKIVNNGDNVIEIGGHIGFISHLYSTLVGTSGQVFVFEPGDNNLKYTRKNLSNLENVELIEKACGDINGVLNFYKDGISGQNNSLLEDYENVDEVAKTHNEAPSRVVSKVDVIRLGDFISSKKLSVNHVKIDVEGAEMQVLQGLGEDLGKIPSFMIEMTRDLEAVYSLMSAAGYLAYDEQLNRLEGTEIPRGNVFFILSSTEIS